MLFVAEYDGDILLCQFADERRGERCRMIVDEDDGDILDSSEGDVVGIVLVGDFEHGILHRKLDGAFEYESLFGHVSPFVVCICVLRSMKLTNYKPRIFCQKIFQICNKGIFIQLHGYLPRRNQYHDYTSAQYQTSLSFYHKPFWFRDDFLQKRWSFPLLFGHFLPSS